MKLLHLVTAFTFIMVVVERWQIKTERRFAMSGGRADFLKEMRLRMRPRDLELVMKAYDLSKEAHRDQIRDDGTRYFEHLRATALILIELGIYDPDLLISCLLHDAIEDNPRFMSRSAIASIFNDRVARIVIGVTKPKKSDSRFPSDEVRHIYYFAKLSEADTDTLIVKLADRLHNMRTLGGCTKAKQKRKAKETRTIYLPLCDRLMSTHNELGKYFKRVLIELIEEY